MNNTILPELIGWTVGLLIGWHIGQAAPDVLDWLANGGLDAVRHAWSAYITPNPIRP